MKRVITTLIICLFLSVSATASTWYVSTAGAGGKDGTAYGDRWDAFANVVWGGGGVVAGDTLYVCGLMREQLAIGVTGSSGNIVTIRGDYTGDAGIINGADDVTTSGWADQGGDVWRHAIGATTVELVMFNDGNIGVEDATPAADYEWTYSNPNLDIYAESDPDLGYYSSIEAQQRNICIQGTDLSYITIQNITVRYGNYGIFCINTGGGASNWIIDNCDSGYNYKDGVIIYDGTNTASDITIKNCTLHNSQNKSGIYTSRMDGGLIENNDCYSNFEHGYYCSRTDNIIIRYNSFYSNGFNGWKFQAGSSDNQAYYNLSYSNGTQGLRIGDIDGTAQNNTVYNNVFYDNAAFGIYIMGSNVGANTLKNNIIHQARAGTGTSMCLKIGSDAVAQLLTLDYNSYYYPGATTPDDVVIVTGVAYYNLTEWKVAGYAQDASSVGTDPTFVTGGSNFRLKAGSPCINTGVDVSLTTDYAGNSVEDPPEMGVFEVRRYLIANSEL